MRIWKTFAIAALLTSVSSLPSIGFSQGAAPATQSSKIGVVDVGYIFKNHPTMKSRIETIDAQIKSAEEAINGRREVVLKEIEKLRSLREDTVDYKQGEEKIAKMEAELKLEFMRKEKEFGEAKATIIYDAYRQVESIVKAIAEYNQIEIVLRYSKEEMDPKKPASVTGGINRDIVYFKGNIDLTDGVLSLLSQPQQTAAAPATAPRR